MAGDWMGALASIAGGAWDEAAAKVSDPSAPEDWLVRGLIARHRGLRTDVAHAAEQVAAGGEVRRKVQAARLCFNGSVLGQPGSQRLGKGHLDLPAARAHALAAVADDPGAVHGWWVLAEIEDALDDPARRLAALEQAAACRPDDPSVAARVARARFAEGDREGAGVHVRRGLAADPGHAGLLDLRARVEPSAESIAAALAADPRARVDAVLRFVALGELERAEDAISGAAPLADAMRARFALWRGEDDVAATLVQGNAEPLAQLVAGALALRAGRASEAVSILGACLDTVQAHPRSELDAASVRTWLAEAHHAAGSRPRAVQEASAAMAASPTYAFSAHLVRLAAHVDPRGADHLLDPPAWAHMAPKLRPLLADPTVLDSGRQRDVVAAVEEVLTLFGGNRSTTPTRVVGGRLERVHVPEHARHAARQLEHGLRFSSIEAVVHAYRDLQARHPDDPTPFTYQGEVLVWAGRYDEAAASFQRALALDGTTTWAWIGLGACASLGGEAAEALRIWERGVAASRFEGPTLFAYRAEAKWRLGDRTGALADLDVALRSKPQRLSAWVLRALVGLDEGASRPARVVAGAIRARAPGMWLSACAAVGTDRGGLDPVRAHLEAVLTAMRGNRSSSMVTWFDAEDRLRITWWRRPWLTVEHLRPPPR